MCSPMIGQFFDTKIVASSDKECLYNDPSKSKCWKNCFEPPFNVKFAFG